MKMKRTWIKILLGVFTTVMLASVFTFVDMGWNVIKVNAANESSVTFNYYNSDAGAGISKIEKVSGNVTLTLTLDKGYFMFGNYGLRSFENPAQLNISANVKNGCATKIEIIPGENKGYTIIRSGTGPWSLKVGGPYIYDTDSVTIWEIKSIIVTYHVCSSSETINGLEARCNAAGYKVAYKCSCGRYYSNSACTTLIANNYNDYYTWRTTGGGLLPATNIHNDGYSSFDQSTKK